MQVCDVAVGVSLCRSFSNLQMKLRQCTDADTYLLASWELLIRTAWKGLFSDPDMPIAEYECNIQAEK